MRSAEENFTRYPQLIVKRVFDIAASAIVLLVLSPLFSLASLAIKLESRGPIFSVKHVYCYNNQHVRVLRFRSRSHRDVTICGRFLIRTGLDQIPMLLNVLRGEMSIVGLHCHFLPPPQLNDQLELAFVTRSFRPGLVSLKDPQARADGMSRRDADLFYISNWSLLLDAKVLFQHLFSKIRTFRIRATAIVVAVPTRLRLAPYGTSLAVRADTAANLGSVGALLGCPQRNIGY